MLKMNKINRSNAILTAVLALCLVVFVILLVAVIKNAVQPTIQPNAEWIEIPNLENMALAEAKARLDELNIAYEIVPTSSRIANRVERFEYSGKTENGKILATVGTSIKLHANEVGIDRVVYLTFDDGPKVNYTYDMEVYHTTKDLLDVLDKYGIKASFFMVGYQMIKTDRSAYVKDTMDRGHLIACHTSTHELGNIYSSISKFVEDIERFENELKDILGEEIYKSLGKYIRFPGGSSTNGYLSTSEAQEYISAVRSMGYKVYDWTALTGDAEGMKTASDFISYMDKGIEKAKQNNQPLIVLMHDTDDTTQALPEILNHLTSNGYYFDTIDNCPEYTFTE